MHVLQEKHLAAGDLYAMIFRGFNNSLNPVDLQETESPDCMNVRPYKGRQGVLGPRPGFEYEMSVANPILDFVPFQLNSGKQWLVAKNNGVIMPVEQGVSGTAQILATSGIGYDSVTYPATTSTTTGSCGPYDLKDYDGILIYVNVKSFLDMSGPASSSLNFHIKFYPIINGVELASTILDVLLQATPAADGSGSAYGYAGPAIEQYFMVPSPGSGSMDGYRATVSNVSWPAETTAGIIDNL